MSPYNFHLGASPIVKLLRTATQERSRARWSVLPLALLAYLSGCNAHRPPVVEDKVGGFLGINEELGTLAVAPDYSVAFVQLSNTEHPASSGRGNKFCAQAPADAGADLSSALSGAVKAANGSGQTVDLSGAAKFASSIRQLFVRSQGVQFFRDGSFALCNAYLNGAIDEDRYNEQLSALRTAAVALIEKQIPYIDRVAADTRPAWMTPDRSNDDPASSGTGAPR